MLRKLARTIFPFEARQWMRRFYRNYISAFYCSIPMKEQFEDYDGYWNIRQVPPEDPRGYGPFERAVAVDKSIQKLFKGPISILEIGAGDGFILNYLKNKGHKVLGADLSERAVEIMQADGIPAKKADIIHEKISDEKYDLVLLASVLEHIPEAEVFFNESYRYAKQYMLVIIPNTGYWVNRIRLGIFGKGPITHVIYHIKEHLRFWTVSDFLDWSKVLNYRIEYYVGVRGVPILYKVAPRLFASTVLYVVSRVPKAENE